MIRKYSPFKRRMSINSLETFWHIRHIGNWLYSIPIYIIYAREKDELSVLHYLMTNIT